MQLINLVAMVTVADVDRSIRFYRDILQFEVSNTYEANDRLIWALFQSGDAQLMVALADPPEEQAPLRSGTDQLEKLEKVEKDVLLYLYPDDVEAWHQMLQAKGCAVSELSSTVYGMQEFRLTDPDGYELCFGQEADLATDLPAA